MEKNLLAETIEVLRQNGKTSDDVEWVGGADRSFTWDEFAAVAEHTYYDSSYGAQKIATDLVVVGLDFWLSRGEYDGSEWWDFHTMPIEPPKGDVKYLKTHNVGWDTLADIHEDNHE